MVSSISSERLENCMTGTVIVARTARPQCVCEGDVLGSKAMSLRLRGDFYCSACLRRLTPFTVVAPISGQLAIPMVFSTSLRPIL